MPSASAEVLARQTQMTMGCATMWTTASEHLMNVVCAMVQEPFWNVDVNLCQKGRAIVMASSWTPLECAAVNALPMSMPMGSVTMWTTALAWWTNVACATVLVPFTSAVAKTSPPANVIATAMLWTWSEFVEADANPTTMPTAFAMWTKCLDARTTTPATTISLPT